MQSHPALIINPRSGGGTAERVDLRGTCLARGIEPIMLAPADDITALATDAVARGADMIGAAGGDGTQALVAAVASRHDIPYVCVPAGTRNHFAFDVGIDREDVVGALDAFACGRERRIDLASVNHRVFVNNVSLGVYAKVVQSDAYRNAKVATTMHMLPDLLPPRAAPFDLRFTAPDGERWDGAQLVLVSNNPYRPPRPGASGNRRDIDGGVLGVIAMRVVEPGALAALAAMESTGRIPHRGWLDATPREFTVDSGGSVEVAIDGEAAVLDPPLRFASLPSALRLRLPLRR